MPSAGNCSDCEQACAAWAGARRDQSVHYAGSLSWKTVGGRRYLYRKKGDGWKCVGPEGDATRLAHERFHRGRAESRQRLAELDGVIRRQAKILKAMGLGRVPLTAARVLRRLERIGSLGQGIMVAGTNALYAYERLAGVHFDADLAATLDVDLLYDARGGLNLYTSGLAGEGLIGLLTSIDKSFKPTDPGSFRAVNDRGYMVDLITPAVRNPAMRKFQPTLGGAADDLAAAEIDGLAWLESCPAIEVVVLDESGFPLTIVAPDPRAFICHKLWVADRADRDPLKRKRDRQQAYGVCRALVSQLPELRFDDPSLHALPAELRAKGVALAANIDADLHGATTVGDWD